MSTPARKIPVSSRVKRCPTEIGLDSQYSLRGEETQWTLVRRAGMRKPPRGGRPVPYWKPVGYHPSIESAVKHFCELRLRLSGAQSFQELLRVQKETQALIAEVLNHDERRTKS